MRKAVIRATAKRLQVYAQQFGRFTQHGYQGVHSHNNLETEKEIEVALTQAHNEAVEAFANELRNWNLYGRAEIADKISEIIRIKEAA